MARYQLTIFLLLLLSSCIRPPHIDDPVGDALSKWKKARISDYTYVVRPRCYCREGKTAPNEIKVQGGKIVSVNGMPYEREISGNLYTIDGLFDYLKQRNATPHFLKEMEFDPRNGIPTHVYFDRDERIRDEEYGWDITSFRAD